MEIDRFGTLENVSARNRTVWSKTDPSACYDEEDENQRLEFVIKWNKQRDDVLDEALIES